MKTCDSVGTEKTPEAIRRRIARERAESEENSGEAKGSEAGD